MRSKTISIIMTLFSVLFIVAIIWINALDAHVREAGAGIRRVNASITEYQHKNKELKEDNTGMIQMLAEKDVYISDLISANEELKEINDDLMTDVCYFERLGEFKLTWYITDLIHTGYITASGERADDHVIAMNRKDMKRYGLSWGDEMVVVYKDKVEWRELLDTGCAEGVVDLYTTGEVPDWGVAPCRIYVKRTGGFN
jgi:hypothetical protein